MYKNFMLTDYFAEVYGDVESILDEEKPTTSGDAMYALEKEYDKITGEITGSYGCNNETAKEKVLNEFIMFIYAADWFGITPNIIGDWFYNGKWKRMDVLIRQFVYEFALTEMIEMWFEKENND